MALDSDWRKTRENNCICPLFLIFIDFHHIISYSSSKSYFDIINLLAAIENASYCHSLSYDCHDVRGPHDVCKKRQTKTNIAFQNNPKRTCAYMVKRARGCSWYLKSQKSNLSCSMKMSMRLLLSSWMGAQTQPNLSQRETLPEIVGVGCN